MHETVANKRERDRGAAEDDSPQKSAAGFTGGDADAG
jgi:hypothetical protein